ncbi:hypothetical protein E2C01_072143 [Portunus trituberculatus]|uniref:Uncharacterized protein n=1 Tax=Portunus trituberculatus TaxID=210409 RepID=A0A5B7IAB2_PORTR|nr:hypothetical protein [Portunus trituberculatus]
MAVVVVEGVAGRVVSERRFATSQPGQQWAAWSLVGVVAGAGMRGRVLSETLITWEPTVRGTEGSPPLLLDVSLNSLVSGEKVVVVVVV